MNWHRICFFFIYLFFSAVVWQFLSGVEGWVKACSEGGLPTAMQELELAIHSHQNLYEQVTTAYTEVHVDAVHNAFIHTLTTAYYIIVMFR